MTLAGAAGVEEAGVVNRQLSAREVEVGVVAQMRSWEFEKEEAEVELWYARDPGEGAVGEVDS